jgi:RloB-like protein
MARRNDSLRRRRPFREAKRRILIVCEGEVTEPEYFNDLRHQTRSLIELQIERGGTPKTLVERAVDLKKSAEKDAKRGKDENLKYDVAWCVFDIDEHPFLAEAQQQARDNGIRIAVSNPCFELWALLHFQDQRAHIERREVQRLCKHYMRGYEKKLPCETLLPNYTDAVRRSEDLDQWHYSRGTSGENPSTSVHKLTQEITKEGRPASIQ